MRRLCISLGYHSLICFTLLCRRTWWVWLSLLSILLLGDFSLVLLTLLQLYSLSLADVFLVLFTVPLGNLLPFLAGINALFSHGPRRSAGLARVYALWNVTSFINIGVAFVCGYVHYQTQSSKKKPKLSAMEYD